MHLQLLIVVVEHVAEVLAAQVARQVHPMQVLAEDIAIEVELFAEVAPWVRQDLGAAIVRRVSMLYVRPQLLHVVYTLLSNEDGAALQADQTERLLMRGLHMAP